MYVDVSWVCTCVTIAMAGCLHGVCVGACWVVSPQGGFSLSLFCNTSRCIEKVEGWERQVLHAESPRSGTVSSLGVQAAAVCCLSMQDCCVFSNGASRWSMVWFR